MRLAAIGLTTLALPLVLLAAGTAFAAEPAPTAPAAAPAVPEPGDEVLRRVLRSSCRDGLPEVREIAAAGTASWAGTVGRLCGDILRTQAPPVVVAPLPADARARNEGRGRIVIASTIYGIWVGIATDVLLEFDTPRSVIIPPLLGMTAGLGLSLVLTKDHPMSNGQAWTYITGLEYGSFNGALWAGGLDFSAKGVVEAALATGLASGAISLLVADKLAPRQGDVEVVRSGLLWGTIAGMLGMLTVSDGGSQQTFLRGMGVSMDLGFLGGLALAASYDVSTNRVLVIDAGTLGGGLAGLGISILAISGSSDPNTHVIAGSALAGMAVGMAAAIYFTRDFDPPDEARGANVAALLGRDERGRWSWGTPGPVPVMDGTGHKLVGATFTALGGTF